MQDNQKEEGFQVKQGANESLLIEFYMFLKDNKKWWLLPIILCLILFGALIILSSTSAMPFIYTLF